MKLEQENPNSKSFIYRYNENSVVVNQQTYTQSVFFGTQISPQLWLNATPHSLTVQHVEQLFNHCEQTPEILIIGTGRQQTFPSIQVQQFIIQRKCPVEYMNTPAACRTFNILMGENRQVIAGLLLDQPQ